MTSTQALPPSDIMAANAVKAADLLKQLANAKRLEILCALMKGERAVRDLALLVNLSQSAVSQHLARMKQAGLIRNEKRGTMAFYTIASMEVSALLSTLYLIYCRE